MATLIWDEDLPPNAFETITRTYAPNRTVEVDTLPDGEVSVYIGLGEDIELDPPNCIRGRE